MQTLNFSCKIQCDADGINPLHLCEEIQAYLNSNHYTLDENNDEYVNAKVLGYNLEVERLTPFYAKDEY
jgi:hypothetical protein|tara:strand:+ start:215 stop:421 length:207 start_codon:yes stop_codon:yes gene_type:complete